MLQSVIHRLWGLDLRKSGLSPIFPLKSAILIICQESEEIRLLSFGDLYQYHSKSGCYPADDLYHCHLVAISLQCGTLNSKDINSFIFSNSDRKNQEIHKKKQIICHIFGELVFAHMSRGNTTQQREILKQYSPEETQQMHRADILANLRKHRKMDESGLGCN